VVVRSVPLIGLVVKELRQQKAVELRSIRQPGWHSPHLSIRFVGYPVYPSC
jgi:hypothetical protein